MSVTTDQTDAKICVVILANFDSKHPKPTLDYWIYSARSSAVNACQLLCELVKNARPIDISNGWTYQCDMRLRQRCLETGSNDSTLFRFQFDLSTAERTDHPRRFEQFERLATKWTLYESSTEPRVMNFKFVDWSLLERRHVCGNIDKSSNEPNQTHKCIDFRSQEAMQGAINGKIA